MPRLTHSSVFMAVAIFLVVPAVAQDLKPKDYSPSDDVPIRVEKVGPSAIGSEIVVVVGNRTKAPLDATVECSLYGADGALGSEGVVVSTVPPGGEAVKSAPSFTPGATSATCRITDIRPSS